MRRVTARARWQLANLSCTRLICSLLACACLAATMQQAAENMLQREISGKTFPSPDAGSQKR